MSVPTIGYPDYQRLNSQSGDVIHTFFSPVNGNLGVGTFDCHGYGYIDISVNDLGGSAYFSVTLSFDLFSDGSGEVATYQFIPTPGGEQTLQYAVIARYVTVTVSWISGVKTDVPLIVLFGANSLASDRMTSQPSMPAIYAALPIAASSNMAVQGTTTVQGAGILTISDTGNANWFALVQFWEASVQAFADFMVLFGATYGQTASVQLGVPPAPLRIQVNNTDTASHTFYVSLGMQ